MTYVDENVKKDAKLIHDEWEKYKSDLYIPDPEYVIIEYAKEILVSVTEDIIMGYHPCLGAKKDPADDVVDTTDIIDNIIYDCAVALTEKFVRREISVQMHTYVSMFLSHLIAGEVPGSPYYGLDDEEVVRKMIPENHLELIKFELKLKALKDKNG